jgi:hypothetical protein
MTVVIDLGLATLLKFFLRLSKKREWQREALPLSLFEFSNFYNLTSISTPAAKSSFISASMVFAEGW